MPRSSERLELQMRRLRCVRETDLAQVRRIERASHALPGPITCFRQALRRRRYCWTMEDRGAVADIRFYRSMGFRPAGLRRAYYPGPGPRTRAMLMTRELA